MLRCLGELWIVHPAAHDWRPGGVCDGSPLERQSRRYGTTDPERSVVTVTIARIYIYMYAEDTQADAFVSHRRSRKTTRFRPKISVAYLDNVGVDCVMSTASVGSRGLY